MAEQSAFLTAFDEMQKKKGGFNAPAPLESVVDTVGQAPAVQSPFSQQAAAATAPLAAPIDLAAAPAVQAPAGIDPFAAQPAPPAVDERSFMQKAGDFLGTTQLGENLGNYYGAQKYGTGISAEGEVTGRPRRPGTLMGDSLTAAATGLEAAGNYVVDPVVAATKALGAGAGSAAEYVSGVDLFDGGPVTEEPAAEPAVGTPTFGLADPSSSTATGEDPFSGPIVKPATPAMADPSQQIQLKDSGSSTVGLNSTQAMLQERFGSPTISGIQSAEEGLGLRTDAQGRMVDPNVDRSSFEQASADREARQAARPDFGEAVSDRDRRAARGEGISDADRRDIAKAQSPNASASDRARGMKVAEKAGLDWRTGQPLKQDKETGGLTDYQAITAQQRQTEIDLKIADGMEEKEAKREVAYEESRSNVRSTQDSFDKLRPVAEEIALLSGSKFTEGALGWTASKLPFSTDAAQIERLTTEFEGSAFLQGLIDAKAKGATFGALSEREGDRILGQWGKITSPKSTNEERIRAVNSMLESIQRSSERAASDHKEKFPDRSASSSKAKAQGSPEGKRHAKDQDHGAKVETYFQT